MTGLLVDLRSALRQYSRHRGLTVVALTSLAVGIAVSMAIVTASTAVLVRSLPYHKPEDLVMIWGAYEPSPALARFWNPRDLARGTLTPGTVLQWKDHHLPFDSFAVLESWQTGASARVDLLDHGHVDPLRGTYATAHVFDVFGTQAALGRTFGEDETDVAVLSDALWRRRFGSDPGIVGQTVTITMGRLHEQRPVTIIGVLPKGFHVTYPEETEIWFPLTWSEIDRLPHFAVLYRGVARLRRGVSLSAAEAQIQGLREPSQRSSTTRIWLEPMHQYAVGTSRESLLLVLALGLLVLLSGAVNAATVFAASAVSRLREMQIRRALGASRARLIRQIFSEVSVVGLVSGAIGIAAISLALPALRAAMPAGLPGVEAMRLDWMTVSLVGVAVAGSTAIAGLVPAWLCTRDRSRDTAFESHTMTIAAAGVRARMALLAMQFAFVTVLLIAGGMSTRSFWKITHVDKGFAADSEVHLTEIQLLNPAYRDKEFERFEAELLGKIRQLPYVEAASITSAIPLRGNDRVVRLRRPDGQMMYVNQRNVDADYFKVMRIPLVAGRWLTPADANRSEWVALVSQSLAEALYPGENPVGKFLEGSSGTRIVGVVADIRAHSLLDAPTPAFYWPRTLQTTNLNWLMLRTTMARAQVSADVGRIVREVYPEQPFKGIVTLDEIVGTSVSDHRAYALIASTFGIAMLLLCALGLSGHLSHVVTERSRDLAIRSALGASLGLRLALLIRHVALALAAGVVIAVAAVSLAYPVVKRFLFEIARFDFVSVFGSILVVASVTAVTLAFPARRLAKPDIATELRSI